MVNYIDISSWARQIHVHTGGTRDKFIVISPNDEKFYFKTSINRGLKNYKYEFWSEIIASELGLHLGFDVLHYDIGSFDNMIGCMSKSIIQEDKEEHHEGYRYIVQKYPDFMHNFRKTHSFQRIVGALENVNLGHLKSNVIEMIVFDAIIGNTDRHSENWALVINKNKDFQQIERGIDLFEKVPWFIRIVVSAYLFIRLRTTVSMLKKEFQQLRSTFSPIYDSGSSLARELSADRISDLMNDDNKMEVFINKGKPDIRWESINLSHIELVETIRVDNQEIVDQIILKLKSKYSKQMLEKIVYYIDKDVPLKFEDYKIPKERKDFIVKYVDLRIQKIMNMYEQVF